jgi:hypothetical protein
VARLLSWRPVERVHAGLDLFGKELRFHGTFTPVLSQQFAGVRRTTWRMLDPSSCPSAKSAAPNFSRLILTERKLPASQGSARQRRWSFGPGFLSWPLLSRPLDFRRSVRSCCAAEKRAVSRTRPFESRWRLGRRPAPELRQTYLITSSARTSRVRRTYLSRASLAVLRLITSSNLIGASVAGQPCLASLQSRATYVLVLTMRLQCWCHSSSSRRRQRILANCPTEIVEAHVPTQSNPMSADRLRRLTQAHD